jgi:cell division septal protein FtsQ
MKKIYKIITLTIVFIFLTTYSPNALNVFPQKKNFLFEIQNIEIINNHLIDEKRIRKRLSKINNKSIIFIKRIDIEKSLESIEFLEKIEVKKKYPNTIVVKIYETKPVAILFKNNNKYLIDSSSNLISYNKNFSTYNLPNIFGDGAEKDFIIFYNQLKNNNFIIREIENFYYFQIGRWDLKLFDNKTIKFPSNKTEEAIQRSVKLLNHKNFKNYKIIDLRIHGKIVAE